MSRVKTHKTQGSASKATLRSSHLFPANTKQCANKVLRAGIILQGTRHSKGLPSQSLGKLLQSLTRSSCSNAWGGASTQFVYGRDKMETWSDMPSAWAMCHARCTLYVYPIFLYIYIYMYTLSSVQPSSHHNHRVKSKKTILQAFDP